LFYCRIFVFWSFFGGLSFLLLMANL